jgi:hypothetical protein
MLQRFRREAIPLSVASSASRELGGLLMSNIILLSRLEASGDDVSPRLSLPFSKTRNISLDMGIKLVKSGFLYLFPLRTFS